ncbi:MAG: hypothetical protein U0Q16_26995 [Bryobacteraceae bacterium]
MLPLLLLFSAILAAQSEQAIPERRDPEWTSRPLFAAETPETPPGRVGAAGDRPVSLKILVLSTDGKEPTANAWKSFLDYVGAPYELVRLTAGDSLPKLDDGSRGSYQAVILATGNLGVCDPNCHSALSPESWTALDTYTRDYGVRVISAYTFPEPRYGVKMLSSGAVPLADPVNAMFTADAAGVFRDLRRDQAVKIGGVFLYRSDAAPAAGEQTIPILKAGEALVAAIHKKADGREVAVITFDNSPVHPHTLLLQYGLFDWATRGVHLGLRKALLTPQVDDLFLPNILFDALDPLCKPAGLVTYSPGTSAGACPTLRISGGDLNEVTRWQRNWQRDPQFALFRLTMAYNGLGMIRNGELLAEDDLLAAARQASQDYFWVSHTYSHKNLDCYASSGDSCRGSNTAESRDEVHENRIAGLRAALPIDYTSMVTPGISGLRNTAFLEGAAEAGVRYLVSDTSRAEGSPAIPNTGVRNPDDPRILFIPRRPTAIFYDSARGQKGEFGSEPDEYNYFYGPAGLFRLADGSPFFSTEQTYDQVLDREADLIVGYLLRGEMYPLMFHQLNLFRFQGGTTLAVDLLDRVLTRWQKLSTIPVESVEMSKLGLMLEQRQAFWTSGVSAAKLPGKGIELRATQPVTLWVTGSCSDRCETVGPFKVSRITLAAGEVRTIPAE